MERLRNIHPGEVLLEEFMKPMSLSRYALSKAICVPSMRIGQICAAKRSVSADTALRLARFFGTSDTFWMGLQVDYDLEESRLRLHERLQAIEPMRLAA